MTKEVDFSKPIEARFSEEGPIKAFVVGQSVDAWAIGIPDPSKNGVTGVIVTVNKYGESVKTKKQIICNIEE